MLVFNYLSFAGFCSIIFVTGFVGFAFADSEIDWNTDSHDYYHRDTIQLLGTVYPIQGEKEILIEIENSQDEIIFSRNAELKSDGNFAEDITILGGTWQPEGQFTLKLTHGKDSASQPIWIFQSESTAPDYIESNIFFDKPTYSMTDLVNFWIVSPDFDENNSKKETIGEKNRGEIEIRTGMGKLSSYVLKETEPGSGIFNGTISLTGDKNLDVDKTTHVDDMTSEFSGEGPENGKIGAYKSDKITVTFSGEFGEISKTAEVSWTLGKLEVETDSSGNLNLIRVIDPDMNFSNLREDVIILTNDFVLYETNVSSGIFEKSFSKPFSQLPITYHDITLPDGDSKWIVYPSEEATTLINPPNLIDNPTLISDSGSIEENFKKIPDWVKTTMHWYVDGIISEEEMVAAIQYLVNIDVIKLR